jgi:uncharacterized membrane protein
MTVADARATRPVKKWKTAFFLLLALMGLVVIYADETFLFHPTDPEWAHIAPFKWLLLVHALFAVPALLIGPLQFSERLRRNVKLHHTLGWIYCGAIFITAPMALYIGVTFEKPLVQPEQIFQAGGWFLTTLMAFIAGYNRNITLHKQWMARSYGFSFIFVASRVTDAWPGLLDYGNERVLATALWSLVVLALIVPDLLMSGAEFFKNRRPKRG